MTPDNKTLAIKKLSNRKEHDKSSLVYIIKILNHSKYFYSYEDRYNRNEWLEKLIAEVNTVEGWNKLTSLKTFEQFKN